MADHDDPGPWVMAVESRRIICGDDGPGVEVRLRGGRVIRMLPGDTFDVRYNVTANGLEEVPR